MKKYKLVGEHKVYRLVGYTGTYGDTYILYHIEDGRFLEVDERQMSDIEFAGLLTNCRGLSDKERKERKLPFRYADLESTKGDMRSKLFQMTSDGKVIRQKNTKGEKIDAYIVVAEVVTGKKEVDYLVMNARGTVRQLTEKKLLEQIEVENKEIEKKNFKVSGGRISAIRGSFPVVGKYVTTT